MDLRGAHGQPVFDRQLPDADERIVTFLDLVQALAVRAVRQRYGLPLQRIRQGVDEARHRYGLDYPLARQHRIYLYSDQQKQGQGHMLIRMGDDALCPEDWYVQLTGRDRGNLMLKQVVEMFLDDLTFDPETGLAKQYRPMRGDDVAVLIDPHRRFGEPVMEPSGYTAEALWHATNTEGGIEEAAVAYGVSVAEIALANRYYDHLLANGAA